jgi:hypothetical protein
MLATNAGPNHDKTWRGFRLESGAALSDEETGSEGGRAEAILQILDRRGVSGRIFSIACISVFLLTIVNHPFAVRRACGSLARGLAVNE